jgi:hypothetical protein
LFVSVPASAEDQPAASEARQEKKICKREQATVSRLASKRICRTAAEWKRAQDEQGGDFELRRSGKLR